MMEKAWRGSKPEVGEGVPLDSSHGICTYLGIKRSLWVDTEVQVRCFRDPVWVLARGEG